MKKVIFTLLILTLSYTGLAQTCQPIGTSFLPKQAGIILPPLQPKQVGESVFPNPMPLYFYLLKDTIVGITISGVSFQDTIVFESYRLDSIANIPPGTRIPLSSCSEPNCLYNPANTEWGCVLYSGTFTQEGTYNITFIFQTEGYLVIDNTYPQQVLLLLSSQGINPGDTIRPGINNPLFSFLDNFIGRVPYVGQQVVERPANISKLRKLGLALVKKQGNYYIVNNSSSYKSISIKLYSILGEEVFNNTAIIAPGMKVMVPSPNSGGIYFLSIKEKNSPEILIKIIMDK